MWMTKTHHLGDFAAQDRLGARSTTPRVRCGGRRCHSGGRLASLATIPSAGVDLRGHGAARDPPRLPGVKGWGVGHGSYQEVRGPVDLNTRTPAGGEDDVDRWWDHRLVVATLEVEAHVVPPHLCPDCLRPLE
jgi:hypothetical protein